MCSDEKVLFDTLYGNIKVALCKKEMALETGISISTLDNLENEGLDVHILKGNGDIFYPLTELAKYYTNVVQTY